MANWSGLSEEILILIKRKIVNTSDFIRFKGVCSSWRSIAKQYEYSCLRQLQPGFLVCDMDNCYTFLFLPLSKTQFEIKSIHNYLPHLSLPTNNSRCCGSYQGWLLMEEESNFHLTLLNPVSQVKFSLPCLDKQIMKAVFSSKPSPSTSEDCYIFAIYNGLGLPVAYCRKEDKFWININTVIPSVYADGYIEDAIFYKGQLYVLHETGVLFVCNINSASPPKMAQLLNTPRRRLSGLLESENCYLVESEGALLLVYRKKDYRNGLRAYKTSMFEVYKLNADGKQWDCVTSLGQYAIFLGRTQSFALSEFNVQGIKGDCIYFLDESLVFLLEPTDHARYDMGVFNLQDSRIRFFRIETPYIKPSAVWLTPLLL